MSRFGGKGSYAKGLQRTETARLKVEMADSSVEPVLRALSKGQRRREELLLMSIEAHESESSPASTEERGEGAEVEAPHAAGRSFEERMNKRTVWISGGRRLIFYSFGAEGAKKCRN